MTAVFKGSVLVLGLVLAVATGCKQGVGEFCQIDGDCKGDLECNVSTNECQERGNQGVVDAATDIDSAPTPDAADEPDAAPEPPDAAPEPPDAATELPDAATPDATLEFDAAPSFH